MTILVSTVYDKPATTLQSVRDFNVSELILLTDTKPDEKQLASIEKIEYSLKDVALIKKQKLNLHNILEIAKEVVNLIDNIPEKERLFFDISQSRKSQVLGVLFGSYIRPDRIEKIVYRNEDNVAIVIPKLNISSNETEKRILKKIDGTENLTKLAKDLKLSRTMLYRYLRNLERLGFIKKENSKFKITDAGKLVLI